MHFTGLQIRVGRFDSGTRLQCLSGFPDRKPFLLVDGLTPG